MLHQIREGEVDPDTSLDHQDQQQRHAHGFKGEQQHHQHDQNGDDAYHCIILTECLLEVIFLGALTGNKYGSIRIITLRHSPDFIYKIKGGLSAFGQCKIQEHPAVPGSGKLILGPLNLGSRFL